MRRIQTVAMPDSAVPVVEDSAAPVDAGRPVPVVDAAPAPVVDAGGTDSAVDTPDSGPPLPPLPGVTCTVIHGYTCDVQVTAIEDVSFRLSPGDQFTILHYSSAGIYEYVFRNPSVFVGGGGYYPYSGDTPYGVPRYGGTVANDGRVDFTFHGARGQADPTCPYVHLIEVTCSGSTYLTP